MRSKLHFLLIAEILVLLFISAGCNTGKEDFTRGVGIYPGDPSEYSGPQLVADKQNYRNIARLRPAYSSSCYDYNLTSQLVTDGIITDRMPVCIAFSTSSGVLPRNEREWLLDHNAVTTYSVKGSDIWIRYDRSGAGVVPEITGIYVDGNLYFDKTKPGGWLFACYGSNDGITWNEIDTERGNGLPGMVRPDPFAAMMRNAGQGRRNRQGRRSNPFAAFMTGPYGSDSTAPRPSFSFGSGFRAPRPQRILKLSFDFREPVAYKSYKIVLNAPSATDWTFGEVAFYNGSEKLKMAPSGYFSSAWMSSGNRDEWVYIDLGSISTFDNLKLYWIAKPSAASVQVSDDARNWNELTTIPSSGELVDDLKLPSAAKGRFVRVLMKGPDTIPHFILSELEVFGKGGLIPVPAPAPAVSGKKLYLTGGNWKVQRASLVESAGEVVSRSGFENPDWVPATVPGTVLVSYLNAGALPDPDFGDNQFLISESFFNSDFWYRNEFDVPSSFNNDRLFLNFDGINWKADVFVNGTRAGRIEGGFIRGKFDVTGLIIPGQQNAIAVLIHKNDNIGIVKEQTALSADKNGGILGADNPTYHASIGWDWIPTIRGRNAGIWNDVFLKATGPVELEDPLVITDLDLPDTTSADITLEVSVKNHSDKPVTGILSGKYGEVLFEKEVSLDPSAEKTVRFDPATFPALHIADPVLWWPRGYGKPHLYDVSLEFRSDDLISDEVLFRSGIREMTYDESDDILNIYVNGRRFIGRGGNWGFPESNLRYRSREYDIAVAYHADMNFTMIRNWVGQTGDDEFYEACDRYGIMIWQDFWLANPADGPDPDNPEMFLLNAEDLVRRIRNHASLALYCGRNEGNPPAVIDTALRTMIPKLHNGIHYISNSAMGVVSGGGPYRALPPRDYYLLYGYNKFHSERGMPNVMTFESLEQTLPDSALWPQNSLWGVHDYCFESAQGADSFNKMVEKGFGAAENAKQFTEFAQWINYDGYRAIFEGRSKFRQGMLLWMSHPAWPSMVWQTYDYYFDPTAAYFGCKKASEPVHIQWNPVYDTVEVVNYSAGFRKGLTARAQIINMDGSVRWEKESVIDIGEDMTARCFKIEFPSDISEVHFIKLTLKEGDKIISDNFYWRGTEDGNYRALKNLQKTVLDSDTRIRKNGRVWILTTDLLNTGDVPALMVRLKVSGLKSGERILPVFFSDNFFSLIPGEKKTITTTLSDDDTKGEKPDVVISGFNL